MTNAKTTLVAIPTYNEASNIRPLINEIWKLLPELHILVIDDNSQDGTAKVVEEMMQNHPSLHLIKRAGKLGLGSAYIAAFKWALQHNFKAVIEMDADFSHSPAALPPMIAALKNYPTVIGSRYISGGTTENWHWFRQLISRAGSLYARLILGVPVLDLTGGFNGWRREVLTTIDLDAIRSEGYSFQIELKYRSFRSGFKIKEIPITFSERREGQSKMSSRIIWEALYRVWTLRLLSRS